MERTASDGRSHFLLLFGLCLPVPTSNSVELAKRLPNSELKIYPDAGHGGIFQAHDAFVPHALHFLAG